MKSLLFLVPEPTCPSTCQWNTIFVIIIMLSLCVCVLDGGQWLGGHISSLHGHPFGMSPTHSAILYDSIATHAFLALLHQPYFSFLIYWGAEHNLNDGVIFPTWRLVWIGERMERIKRGESHHGFAIRLLIFRLKDTIRDSWVLCAEGPSTVYLYRALDQLHFCYIYTVLGR